ncbi:MAG: hypothetical protein KAS32_30220 [Candidatus Peribacteraceae bacterium]|nr:hypothetical protein [Candidatus Peribacteraceae bacterium]
MKNDLSMAKAVMGGGYFDASQELGKMQMVAVLIKSIGLIALGIKEREPELADAKAIDRAISVADVHIRQNATKKQAKKWVSAGFLAVISLGTMRLKKNSKGEPVASVLT